MKADTLLDCALFQLSPKRTRCELFASAGDETEKLASGFLKPFLTHLEAAEEQIARGAGHLIKLEASDRDRVAPWFTKGTLERFVRFVSTPEVLERVYTIDAEMLQLDQAKNFQLAPYSHGCGDQLVAFDSAKDVSRAGLLSKSRSEAEPADVSKRELLRAIDVRLMALQQELSMAFVRAATAGFAIEHMADLMVFAEQFGATRLRDACAKFMALGQKRQEVCPWLVEPSTSSPSSCMSIENGLCDFPPASLSKQAEIADVRGEDGDMVGKHEDSGLVSSVITSQISLDLHSPLFARAAQTGASGFTMSASDVKQAGKVLKKNQAFHSMAVGSQQDKDGVKPSDFCAGYSCHRQESVFSSSAGASNNKTNLINSMQKSPVTNNFIRQFDPFSGFDNLPDSKSNEHGCLGADRLKQREQANGNQSNGNGSLDVLSEQNRGPRTNKTRNQWISPTAIRNSGSQGVVGVNGSQGAVENTEGSGPAINKGQYNRADFPINYDDARFFVIKSYSEDDVHKSIKYNVWSSTPNGNKRLDGAYQDAQERSGGNPGSCPVFLFFSVNASGQFCGVAEMTGPVNFKTNKDFWQQDKWNGYFPVKWHIIKDVSNSHLRHIILENNENKPVTNSRDTQEIKYAQGMEMLNIFKNYSWKTSILDDFLYYEDRQKAMQEKKSRQQIKQQQQLQPAAQVGAHIQLKQSEEESCKFDGQINRSGDLKASEGKSQSSCVNGSQFPDPIPVKHPILASSSIAKKEERMPPKVTDKKKDETKAVNCDGNGVLTVGTVPIDTRVNYDSPSILTVGTMAIDTRGVNCDLPAVVTIGTLAIDTKRTDSGIPNVLTVGTVPIDPKAVKTDGQSAFTVGTVRI